jgi:CubicO group peptidase (beta-lactamase class C family)
VLLTVLLAVLLPGAASAAPRAVPAPPVPVPAAADLTAAEVDAWLDGVLPAALDRADIDGGAVTVVHQARVLTSRGYGSADSGSTGAAPQPDIARIVDTGNPVIPPHPPAGLRRHAAIACAQPCARSAKRL